MKTATRQQILDFLGKNERTSAKAIIAHLGLSPVAVFKQLARLQEYGLIGKQGKPPKVFYFLAGRSIIAMTDSRLEEPALAPAAAALINERFLKIGADGVVRTGTEAFVQWCRARGQDPAKTAGEYEASVRKFDAYKKDGLIDGTFKLKESFARAFLDQLFYLDFYSIERFGKTKLGELILYAKQSQNRGLMRAVADEVRPRIVRLLEERKIDAVGFVPPTVRREVQFMRELERMLDLPAHHLKITKVRLPITVPQKTLSKIEERVENARQSMVVEDEGRYKNVLLIDDALGSGATINEIGRQVRTKDLCSGELLGLALTGSFNGFDVISEA